MTTQETDSLPNFPYTFTSNKKKYVAIAFPKNDLEWLAEHLTIFSEAQPYDFMTIHMDIAKEVSEKIIEPAMMKLQKKNKVQRETQRHTLRRKVLRKIASKQ